VLSDTAGIREAEGKVEREGIRRTIARAEAADLVLWMMDATDPQPELPSDLAAYEQRTLRVLNKIDLTRVKPELRQGWCALSLKTGDGLSELVRAIEHEARRRIGAGDAPVITQARHRQQIVACLEALEAHLAGEAEDLELRAEDLRQAATALGRITGRVDVEDVLDQIFGRFCIGK
jgi:tRNA modification GTPase